MIFVVIRMESGVELLQRSSLGTTSVGNLQKIYLSLVFLLILLGENRVHPPDLREHAAVGQTEAEPEQPQTKLEKK